MGFAVQELLHPTNPVGLRLVEWGGRSSSWCMWKFLNQWERLAPKPHNLQLSFGNQVVDKWCLAPKCLHAFFLGFLLTLSSKCIFSFPPIRNRETSACSPGTSAEASWARWWSWSYFILFYSWSFVASNMCVSILRILSFFSHFSCWILILQFVGLSLGFCFFTHFWGGILIFQLDAHIL